MKNPEKLIGKKVKGFKFEPKINSIHYSDKMHKYIKKEGVIDYYNEYNDSYLIKFKDENSFSYPADQIEAHLVEDEIPTLSDGVMMLVSDDGKQWDERKVVLKSNKGLNKGFYIEGILTSSLVFFRYAKPIEPTKEEQLTAILGSSDKVSEIMELFKN